MAPAWDPYTMMAIVKATPPCKLDRQQRVLRRTELGCTCTLERVRRGEQTCDDTGKAVLDALLLTIAPALPDRASIGEPADVDVELESARGDRPRLRPGRPLAGPLRRWRLDWDLLDALLQMERDDLVEDVRARDRAPVFDVDADREPPVVHRPE